ncbi:TraR/DksA family transcriptional regulator [soil metagenome]
MRGKADIRDGLTKRLTALVAQVARIEQDQGQPLDDDFAEQAIAREDEEVLDGVEAAALAEIDQTRAALARLDAGTYGTCGSCGDPIAPARLAALPATPSCIICAQ